MDNINVIVCGSRGFVWSNEHYAEMCRVLDPLIKAWSANHTVTIISGMATGADTLAMRYAYEHQLKLEKDRITKDDWRIYGLGAGHVRNARMLEYSDKVLAFWDMQSGGTRDCLTGAFLKEIPYRVWDYTQHRYRDWKPTEKKHKGLYEVIVPFFVDWKEE